MSHEILIQRGQYKCWLHRGVGEQKEWEPTIEDDKPNEIEENGDQCLVELGSLSFANTSKGKQQLMQEPPKPPRIAPLRATF